MKTAIFAVVAATAITAACDRQPNPAGNDVGLSSNGAGPSGTQIAPVANDTVATKPATSLPEPRGAIDPTSVEAAGQVVQHYGAEIERGRWLKAEKLWGDLDSARKFATELGAAFGEVHLEVGELGATEGAAGSIYTTVPASFYGKAKSGRPLRRAAAIVLRRVNDVPGSTEQQRRWHIQRIEWKTGG